MDPAAPTQMDPMSWNAYVGIGANPMVFVDIDGREHWNAEMGLLMDRALATTPAGVALANQKFEAHQIAQTKQFNRVLGATLAVGDVAVATAVGMEQMAEAGVKSHIAHISSGAVFGDQTAKNDRSAAMVAHFLTNHPYDTTVNSVSDQFTDIHNADARGDDLNAYRMGGNLAINAALTAAGGVGALRSGVAATGQVVARAGNTVRAVTLAAALESAEVNAAVATSRAAAAQATQATLNRALVGPVVVGEGSNLPNLSPQSTYFQ